MDQNFEENGQLLCEKKSKSFKATKISNGCKKNLSLDGNLVILIVSSSNVARVPEFIKSIAAFAFFLLYQSVLLMVPGAKDQIVDHCLR